MDRSREIPREGGCAACKEIHIGDGEEPPCLTCLPPLFPENVEVYNIWGLVSDQRIYAGMDGIPLALKHEPIWKLIDELEVEDRFGVFSKVLRIFSHINTQELEERRNS